MTHTELAKELSVSKSYLSQVLSGKKKPSKKMLGKLVNFQAQNSVGKNIILSHARLPIPTLHRHDSRVLDACSVESCTVPKNLTRLLLDEFLASRRQGLSKHSMIFYAGLLSKAIGMELSPQGINAFFTTLPCKNGKHSYFRAIRVLCNWMVRNNIVSTNPLNNVDPPTSTGPITRS